jgi:hypothetical protein
VPGAQRQEAFGSLTEQSSRLGQADKRRRDLPDWNGIVSGNSSLAHLNLTNHTGHVRDGEPPVSSTSRLRALVISRLAGYQLPPQTSSRS